MTGESYLTGSTHEDKNGLNKGIGPKKSYRVRRQKLGEGQSVQQSKQCITTKMSRIV